MTAELRYHQAIFARLGREPRFADDRLRQLRRGEERCDLAFPAAIVEWFALEDAEDLFADHTTPDYLVSLEELADPALIGQGFMAVAVENQGVVSWYARLSGSDDPPVYGDNDSPNPADWTICSPSFSAFIAHMIAVGDLDLASDTLTLIAEDRLPDQSLIARLQAEYTRGPGGQSAGRRSYRFFNQHGRLSILCAPAGDGESRVGRWVLEAGSAPDLLELAASVWDHSTLAATLRPKSERPELAAAENSVLRQLRDQRP